MEPVRASSKQRERSVQALASAYRSGQLSTGTFELRVGEALAARTVLDLRRLLADVSLGVRLREFVSGWVASCEAPSDAAAELVLPGPTRTRVSIGRDPRCDVVYDEPTVSRFHASLRRAGDHWVIHDLGSLNGTWVNGRRAERVEVRVADLLQFGDLAARVVS